MSFLGIISILLVYLVYFNFLIDLFIKIEFIRTDDQVTMNQVVWPINFSMIILGLLGALIIYN